MIRPSVAVPSLRRLLPPATLACALAGFDLWLGLRFGSLPAPMVVSNVAVSVSFAAAGIAAWRLRPRSTIGQWMLIYGLIALLANPVEFGIPIDAPGHALLSLVVIPAYGLQLAVLARLFLSYPTGRVRGRAERAAVTATFGLAWLGAPALLVTDTAMPSHCPDWCGPSPIQLVDDPRLFLGLRSALVVGFVSLGVVVLALLIRRIVRSTQRERRTLYFMIAATGLTIVLLAVAHVVIVSIGGYSAAGSAAFFIYFGRLASVAALPVAFLVGLLRQRLQFASVATLVGRLEHLTADTVEAELARALRDPGLRVAFPTVDGWLDVDGAAYRPPADGSRTLTPLGNPPVAVLLHDPTLTQDRELLDAAGGAARLALDNARLQSEVRAQLAEVQASRHRIATAADSERQRLERDLHDGAQQRLLGVGLRLGALRGALDRASRDLVDELERELRTAISELRELAQGIRPTVLTDQGLAPALAGLARRAGVPVTLDLQLDRRLDPVIEATAYYVVSESLQNAVKHAPRAAVHVHAVQADGGLTVEVSDDGPGGASMRGGTGLRGLADRVEAAGGAFTVHSGPGLGTRIRAELPGG